MEKKKRFEMRVPISILERIKLQAEKRGWDMTRYIILAVLDALRRDERGG